MTTIRLHADGLLSKWGFGDGDILNHVLYDWEDETGRSVSNHAVLIAAVRRHLLPALTEDVVVFEICTIHNPIRAESVNGWQPAHFDPNVDYDWAVPHVDVTVDQLRAICEELSTEPANR